jgi:hypothetical protein
MKTPLLSAILPFVLFASVHSKILIMKQADCSTTYSSTSINLVQNYAFEAWAGIDTLGYCDIAVSPSVSYIEWFCNDKLLPPFVRSGVPQSDLFVGYVFDTLVHTIILEINGQRTKADIKSVYLNGLNEFLFKRFDAGNNSVAIRMYSDGVPRVDSSAAPLLLKNNGTVSHVILVVDSLVPAYDSVRIACSDTSVEHHFSNIGKNGVFLAAMVFDACPTGLPKKNALRDNFIDTVSISLFGKNFIDTVRIGVEIYVKHCTEAKNVPTADVVYGRPFTDAMNGTGNKTVFLHYALPSEAPVSICLFNMQGSRVWSTGNRVQPAGRYSVPLTSDRLSSGSYLLVFRAGEVEQRQKVTIIR